MVVRSRAIALGSAFAAAFFAGATSARADTLPLNVGVFPTEGAAEAFYATDLGYFKDAGLDVTLTTITSASAIAAAVASGSLDIGFGSAVPLASARARGINFRIVAPAVIYSGPPASQVMAVAKTSTIQKGADINGTTIGVNGLREFSEFDALAWIEKNGGDLKTIKVAEVPFPEMAGALKAGRISVAAMAEPYLSSARDDIRIIGDPLGAVGPKFTMTCWFGSEAWLLKNPEAAKRFQIAIRRSAVWANTHHAESAGIIAKYTKLTADNLAKIVRSVYGEQPPDPVSVQPVVDVAVKYGGLAPMKAEDLIWQAPR
jgi:NitT/TauT family transport system substrate-binding protein